MPITDQQTIVDKFAFYQENEGNDFFFVKRLELLKFLKFEFIKQFLNDEGVKKGVEDFDKDILEVTEENIKNQIISYLPFAWEKANDEKGLSANRSIDHFKALLWLLNDGSLEKMESIEYEHYGKEKLIFISELVGFDWKSVDNGVRINN